MSSGKPPILLLALLASLLALAAGCNDEEAGPAGPQNASPSVRNVTVEPDTVGLGGVATLAVTASDADTDSLRYDWTATGGTLAAAGPSATWTAPRAPGRFSISVTVSDGRGGATRRTVGVEVIGGSLLIRAGDGTIATDLEGHPFTFSELIGEVEVLDDQVYVGRRNIGILDTTGTIIETVVIPGEVPFWTSFTVLPDAGVAYLNSDRDTVYFHDPGEGTVVAVAMPETSPDLAQTMIGVVAGDALVVAETGTGKLARFDLESHAASVFRDLTTLGGQLGPIGYAGGRFYLGQADRLFAFSEFGDPELLGTSDGADITGVTAAGHFAYFVTASGRLFSLHTGTLDRRLLIEGLDAPRDIVFFGFDLEPPPGR